MGNSSFWFMSISACIILISFIANESINQLSQEEGLGEKNSFFTFEGSSLEEFNSNTNGSYVLNTDIDSLLPETEQNTNVAEDSGFFVSDSFSMVLTWIKTTARYILNFFNAIPNFIKLLFGGRGEAFAFGIGWMWNALFIIVLINYLRGNG